MIQRLAVATPEFKADLAKREVTGYASTFGNVDLGGDVVLKGAFTKTLADDLPAGRIKVRRNHEAAIGMPVHAEEDAKGLLTVSRISKTALGDETLALIADGVVDRMSIGYVAEGKSYGQRDGRKVRELSQLRLVEWSLLDVPPMNPEATITGLKSLIDAEVALDQVRWLLSALRTAATAHPQIVDLARQVLAEFDGFLSQPAPVPDPDATAVIALFGELRQTLTTVRS